MRFALTIAAALIAIALWWHLRPAGTTADRDPQSPDPAAGAVADAARPADKTDPAATNDPGAIPGTPSASPRVAAATARNAYRFIFAEGRCSLEAVEEIHGDFRAPRGARGGAAPGQWSCRLYGPGGKLLAEEAIPAPDHACIVLDPHLPDADGAPRATRFTLSGPVVFQVRMPRFKDALEMRIYRVTQARPAASVTEPPGPLIAAIPLSE